MAHNLLKKGHPLVSSQHNTAHTDCTTTGCHSALTASLLCCCGWVWLRLCTTWCREVWKYCSPTRLPLVRLCVSPARQPMSHSTAE